MPDEDITKPGVTGDPPPPPPPPNSSAKSATLYPDAAMSVADGKGTGALGDQVHPDTQTSEADGHRTLVQPVTDPGPYVPDGAMGMKHPDRTKGEHRYSDVNDSIKVVQRTSTGHDLGFARPDGDTHSVVELAPDVAISGAASEDYYPSTGKEKSMTASAEALAKEPRVLAPVRE